jgi:hypothetical protein
MSGLEERSKPLLLGLGHSKRNVFDLSHAEQATLSGWAAKTALVLHAAAGFTRRTIPLDVYSVIGDRPRDLPPGLSVFTFQTPDLADDILPVTAFQSMDWQLLIRGTPPDERPATIKISIRIGALHLLVAYISDPTWSIVTWRNVHLPLWPTRLGLTYELGLRHNFIRPRKESATVLFNVSLVMARGLSQSDVDMSDRLSLERTLEDAFKRLGGEVVRTESDASR